MKKLIIEICAGALLIIAIIILVFICVNLSKEKQRAKNNYEAILEDRAQQQELTLKELKQFYSEELDKLKQLGVKPSSVEHLVEISYNVIDTLVYRDTLIKVYDTVLMSDVFKFEVETNCNLISGYIQDDTINIDKIISQDSLLVALYQSKRCLFPKYRRYRAIVYSSCKGDTLQVVNNIKVKR